MLSYFTRPFTRTETTYTTPNPNVEISRLSSALKWLKSGCQNSINSIRTLSTYDVVTTVTYIGSTILTGGASELVTLAVAGSYCGSLLESSTIGQKAWKWLKKQSMCDVVASVGSVGTLVLATNVSEDFVTFATVSSFGITVTHTGVAALHALRGENKEARSRLKTALLFMTLGATGALLSEKASIGGVSAYEIKDDGTRMPLRRVYPSSENQVCTIYQPCFLTKIAQKKFPFLHPLEYYEPSLSLFKSLDSCQWMSEAELYALPIWHLSAKKLGKICFGLNTTYESGDNRAGYYLLWLIKQASGCSYTIPKKNSFHELTVSEVLSQFIGSGTANNLTNFIEILLYQSSRYAKPLGFNFLDQKSSNIFLSFAVEQVQKIVMDRWPNKSAVMSTLFELITPESRLTAAGFWASSNDTTTAAIGNHLLAILRADSFRAALLHLNELKELLPRFDETYVETLFGFPFKDFCKKSFYEGDPNFVRRLTFNDRREVIVHKHLMIGVHQDFRSSHKGEPVFPYLFAYDMSSEKLVWGITLVPTSQETPSLNTSMAPIIFGQPQGWGITYQLQKVGNQISLQFVGEEKVRFIDPETGELNATVVLPNTLQDKYDNLYISPEGITYQIYNHTVRGGRITDGKWHPSFETRSPGGSFLSLSTHCAFLEFDDTFTLIGPTGNKVTINNCIAASTKDNKLYTIEKDPLSKNKKSLLTIRTLKSTDDVVSDVEKSIALNAEEISFSTFCQNGTLILFSKMYGDSSPIFINLHNGEVTYSEHKIPVDASYSITDSGEIWTWDKVSKEIWVISRENITLMGSMGGSRGTALVHTSENNRSYFVDIPY